MTAEQQTPWDAHRAESWMPGDPLYDRAQHPHSLYLFNYRGDPTSETCSCNDAASWPEPRPGYVLGPQNDLRGFINGHRAQQGLPPLEESSEEPEIAGDDTEQAELVDGLAAAVGMPLVPWQRRVLRALLGGGT